MQIMDRLRAWLLRGVAPVLSAAEPERPPMKISLMALAEAKAAGREAVTPWVLPEPFGPYAEKVIAMDEMNPEVGRIYAAQMAGAFSEGLGFLGYPYLAELTQRSEYRHVGETYALECTRKWIKVRGDNEEYVAKLEKALARLKVRDVFREAVEQDAFFGRAQILIDLGDRPNDGEWSRPLMMRKEKIKKGSLKRFRAIEPLWSYPGPYDASNPLAADFYKPRSWQIQTMNVHATRLMTIVGREMPDLLKPAYSFGGLSLSQMAKPYIDNWLRARQSISDLLHSFSTMVLSTNMSSVLAGNGVEDLISRAQLFNQARDNRGLMMVDKDQEMLTNVSTPLGTLDKLQAQAQEQIASVTGIPLVVLLGTTPAGLNASSDGELKTFYARVHGYQERVLREPLETVLRLVQLSEFGSIDESVEFEFETLWEIDESAAALIRKSDAETDAIFVNAGVVSPEEARERLSNDEEASYFGVDLSGPAPEPPAQTDFDDAAALAEGPGGGWYDDDDQAADEFREQDHPRRADGKFGSGGGGGGGGGGAAKSAKSDAEKAQGRAKGVSEAPTTHPRIAALLGEEGVARLRKLVGNKNSTAEEITAALAPVEAAMQESTPTLAHGEEPDAAFWKRRKYALGPGAAATASSAQMKKYLVDVAKSYADDGDGVGLRFEKKARILLGPPAAGKSTSAEEIARQFGYAIADGDDAKKVIPEFDDGVGASAVHEESSFIGANVLYDLLKEGANVILPLVGGSPGSIRKRIAALQEAGYSVTIDVVDVNPDEAARRRAGRTLSKGRHISSSYAMSIGSGPQKTYNTLKQEYPDIGFGRIDGNGPPRSERYLEAINHPDASEGKSVF